MRRWLAAAIAMVAAASGRATAAPDVADKHGATVPLAQQAAAAARAFQMPRPLDCFTTKAVAAAVAKIAAFVASVLKL